MISLLVSSKTMVPHQAPFSISSTEPQFLTQAKQLDDVLKQKSVADLQKLMHLSQKLAEATHQRIQRWNSTDGTPAWYTFVGDVYKGLKIDEFSKADVEFAQEHMGTISGLYGVVRPLDLITPYRLELMYKLTGPDFKDLYDFWGDRIAKIISENEPVINLSSEEYIKVLRPFLPKEQIITPWFLQLKNGKPDFQVIHAKIARGTMARWITKHRVNDPKELVKFDYDGYRYSPTDSTPLKPAFLR